MADVTAYANASTTPGTNASLNSISILGTGLLSTADDSFRNSIALAAKFYSDITAQDTVGGTGDTISVTTPTLYTAYAPIRLLFTASAANTTATTLNLDGLGAKAVRKISGGTDVALIAGDIPAGARVDVVYSAAANSAAGGWIIIGSSAGLPAATNAQAATATSTTVALTPANLAQERGYSSDIFINVTLGTPTVSGSALTIPLKGVDGNDHSATNPGYINFRNATVGSGATSQLTIIAATSIVVSSGSTLGATNNIAFKGWIVGFNDAGTFRLGVINCTTINSGVLKQYPLAAWGIASSTAEGGAGAADSAQTFYTGTAVTSKAYTVLGYFSYEAGLAAVGTYGIAPTRAQTFSLGVPLPGIAFQPQTDFASGVTSTATVMPYDNTIPQNTEGGQFLAPTITPSSAANVLLHQVDAQLATSTGGNVCGALFQDTTVNAFAANADEPDTGNADGKFVMTVYTIAGSSSAIAFKFRAGPATANTLYQNANASGTPIFGGVSQSVYSVTEISA